MSGELRYVRAPVPVRFPESEEVPESKQHFRLRTLLYDFLALAFADRATIGSDQFVYWDPTDPQACLAPDAFVRLGEPDHLFKSPQRLIGQALTAILADWWRGNGSVRLWLCQASSVTCALGST